MDPKYLKFSGLPEYLFNIDGLEFYGKMNFLKGGIHLFRCDKYRQPNVRKGNPD